MIPHLNEAKVSLIQVILPLLLLSCLPLASPSPSTTCSLPDLQLLGRIIVDRDNVLCLLNLKVTGKLSWSVRQSIQILMKGKRTLTDGFDMKRGV